MITENEEVELYHHRRYKVKKLIQSVLGKINYDKWDDIEYNLVEAVDLVKKIKNKARSHSQSKENYNTFQSSGKGTILEL